MDKSVLSKWEALPDGIECKGLLLFSVLGAEFSFHLFFNEQNESYLSCLLPMCILQLLSAAGESSVLVIHSLVLLLPENVSLRVVVMCEPVWFLLYIATVLL